MRKLIETGRGKVKFGEEGEQFVVEFLGLLARNHLLHG